MATENAKKRILHIVVYPGLGRATEPLRTLIEGERLAGATHEHHLCLLVEKGRFPEAKREAAQLGSSVRSTTLIPWRADTCPMGGWQIWRAIRRTSPDIVHLWSTRVAGPILFTAALSGIDAVVYSPDEISSLPSPPGPIRRLLGGEMSSILVDTRAARAACVAQGYRPADVRVVLPDLPDESEATDDSTKSFVLRNCSPSRDQLLERFGLPDDARLIGTACPLRRNQRLKDAIWSTDLLKVIRDDVYLLIAGDGPHRERILRFRDNVQIQDKVHFLPEEDAADLLAAGVDLWWQTGPGDGGTVRRTLAAMQAGRTVIATDTAAHREIIEPDRTGILFPTGDRAALAQASQRLLESTDRACLLARAAKEEAARRLDPKAIAENYLRAYEEIA